MSGYKTVNFQITIPVGDFCYRRTGSGESYVRCEFFDNSGGHPTCNMGFDLPVHDNDPDGCRKAPTCLALMED